MREQKTLNGRKWMSAKNCFLTNKFHMANRKPFLANENAHGTPRQTSNDSKRTNLNRFNFSMLANAMRETELF